jgi:hypothetical protein
MAEADFTQERDTSLFQLKSYKWRNIDICPDAAIFLLEKAFQAAYSIEGLTKILGESLNNRSFGEKGLGERAESQILQSIDLIASAINNDICSYADSIDEKVEALELSKQ